MIQNKKILFLTGTRADYGKIEPLARVLQMEGFKISFFITGMHMLQKYGDTREVVKKFPNCDFTEFSNQKDGDSQDLILSKTIIGFSDFIHEHKPDLVIIHGDRIEALAVSIVCALKNIRSLHIEGGEISGTIDESLRHCNTKLCTTHFVSNIDAKERIRKLGEEDFRIHIIGSPELDTHSKPTGISISEVLSHYSIPFSEYGIVIFHPVTTELDNLLHQTNILFNTLRKTKKNYVVISPNNDPGSDIIFQQIKTLPKKRFRVIPSMRFIYFSELLKNSSIVIGNSSVGVREAPFLGISSIDLGTRQKNRSNSKSIINIENFDQLKLISNINQLWNKKFKKDNYFGYGNSAELFCKILKNKNFWNTPLQKKFHEINC